MPDNQRNFPYEQGWAGSTMSRRLCHVDNVTSTLSIMKRQQCRIFDVACWYCITYFDIYAKKERKIAPIRRGPSQRFQKGLWAMFRKLISLCNGWYKQHRNELKIHFIKSFHLKDWHAPFSFTVLRLTTFLKYILN